MPDLPCPFLAATGVPCPLCGGTRAVTLALQGDPAFLDFGAVWVLVLAAVLLAGAARLAGVRLPRPPLLATTLTVLAVAWGWALANADSITA